VYVGRRVHCTKHRRALFQGVAFEQSHRIAALQSRYQVHFEERPNAATSTTCGSVGLAVAAVDVDPGNTYSLAFTVICGPRGLLVVVNHGTAEAAIARALCGAVGFALVTSCGAGCLQRPSCGSRAAVLLDARLGARLCIPRGRPPTIFVLISNLL